MASSSLTSALRETLECFEESGVPQTTTEVAETLALGRRSTYDRLHRLVEQDELETKKVGGNGRVWWRPRDERTAAESGGQAWSVSAERFEQLVDAVEEYAIFTLDTEGVIQTWNAGAEHIKGYEPEEIIGEHFSTVYTDSDCEAGVPGRNLEAAATEGSVEDRGWRLRGDGSRFWADVTITAIRDDTDALRGFLKVTRDITERREYEEQLRQQRDYTRQLLETAPVGVLTVEPDGTFTTANNRTIELLELERTSDGRTQGENGEWTVGVKAVYDEDGEFIPPDERPYVRVFETGESIRNWHAQIELSNGSRRWLSTNIEPVTDDMGDVERILVTLKDITQPKEQTELLERQRDDLEAELDDVFDRVDDGFLALDEEFRFTYVNAHAADLLERSATELIDEYVWDVFEPEPKSKRALETALESQQQVSFEQFYVPFDCWFEVHVYPSENGLSVYFCDITERREREQELKQFERLFTESRDVNVVLEPDGTYRYVTPSMKSEFGHDPEALVGENAFDYVHPDDYDRVLQTFVEMVENPEREPTAEYRFRREDGSWAVVESRGRNLLDDPDVEGIVVYNWDITERKEREREVRRQRERLAALNNLNALVRDITDAVIQQSTREEIEEIVCDRVASAQSYEFAWIGEVDAATQTVNLRMEAGVEGYLDGVTVSVDPEDERSQGPTGRALRTGTIQTTHDVATDSRHDPWREYVEQYDFRSSTAIPLVHGDTTYGVLNIYADRPGAFEDEEQEVISQIGEIVGHAIAAVDRKQALVCDTVTELEFRLTDAFRTLGVEPIGDGRIDFDRTVQVDDNVFLQYGTVDEEVIDTFRAMVPQIPHFEELSVLDGDGSRRFELRLSNPPAASAIAEYGGHIQRAAIENDEFYLAVHLPPSVPARQLIGTVHDIYPGTQLLSRRQITRDDESLEPVFTAITRELTDRQRTVLEAATYSGFFEWPRESAGEDVAESLGIASPTFSQHLRKAQKKVFTALFQGSIPP